MELTGAAALRRPLAVVPGQRTTRRAPSRVSCVGRASFADEAHLRYYEAAPRKAVEAAARDLSRLRAMGLVAGDAAKEKILSVSPPSSPIEFVVPFPNYPCFPRIRVLMRHEYSVYLFVAVYYCD